MVPAIVLRLDESVNIGGERGQRLIRPQPVVALLPVAIFDALQQPCLANLHILIQVGAGNGQEFHPLKKRVIRILSLFEHTTVELHPGVVPAVEEVLFRVFPGH